MARIRTIKPDFFTSEDIVSLTPLARVFYIALWCEADREGRLDWRPGTLKIRYLPADNCDIEAIAEELIRLGLIVLYEHGGKRYAEIPTFKTHQVINNRELASTRPARVTHASPRVQGEGRKEGKEMEGKEWKDIGASADADAPTPKSDPIPYQRLADLYNETMTGLPKALKLTDQRRAAIRKAWNLMPETRTLAFWEDYFAACQDDPFLNGTGPYGNGHENWRPDLEYLLKPKVVVKVYEKEVG